MDTQLPTVTTEYLVTLPTGRTTWVAFTPAMLDSTDPDDRAPEAAARSVGGKVTIDNCCKIVKRTK